MPANANTDATGSATVIWTLSTAIGAQTLHVTIAGEPLAAFIATAQPTLAATSDITAVGSEPGVTPFISFVELSGASIANLTVFNSPTERNTTAGQITSTSTPARQLQLALRLTF